MGNPEPIQLDDVDRRLLDALQAGVPLVEEPFAALAGQLGTSPDDVLSRVRALRGDGGVIRQISAIFDSRSFGYRGCLVGAKVDEVRLDEAVAVINAHPGVSHNYRREHAYNLWYTVTVPPHSRLGLERTVDLLHRRSGAAVTRLMPTLRMFKIGVRFDLSEDAAGIVRAAPPGATAVSEQVFDATPADKAMVRILQQDLPADPRPFDAWADQAGVPVEGLLAPARNYVERGIMRRFAAVLRHREVGFGANAMGAWVVPPQQQDAFGAAAATFAAVSHCYLRPTYEDWPYSIFTMVHGKTREACEQTLATIAEATGVRAYAALYSTHEYKKVRVRYFTDDIARWEVEHAAGGQP